MDCQVPTLRRNQWRKSLICRKGKFKMDWIEFINSGKKPAKLLAKKSGSGISEGNGYQCWHVKKGMYRIWNNAGNPVLAAKGYFKILDRGDAL